MEGFSFKTLDCGRPFPPLSGPLWLSAHSYVERVRVPPLPPSPFPPSPLRARPHSPHKYIGPASVVSSRDDGSDDLRAQRRERSTCLPSWNEERGRSAAQPWDKICAEPVKSMGFEGFEVDLAPSEQEERRTKQFDVSP